MIVTDKKYYMDDVYLSKLDLMIKRMQGTDDTVLPIDGDEGQGKTEFAVGTCYYVAYKMGRSYSPDNVIFELDKGIKFASETSDQIIHLDEGALGLLSTQWWNKNQQKFLQLVMMARKKRHFIVICIPKFHKLSRYIIEDRAIGLVHVYSRQNMQKGRFCYFTKSAKEKLYSDWTRKKIKSYKKYYKFHGSFVKAMGKVFTKEQCDEYEAKKDAAILSLTSKGDGRAQIDKFQLQRNKLIVYIKEKEGLSLRKAEKVLEEAGVPLSNPMICNIVNNKGANKGGVLQNA